MYAVREGHLGAASSLLDEGVSARDAEKGNPLHWEWSAAHWAAMGDDVDMLKMFEDKGVDVVSVKDKVGRTPRKVAEEHYKEKAEGFLRGREKKGGGSSRGSSRDRDRRDVSRDRDRRNGSRDRDKRGSSRDRDRRDGSRDRDRRGSSRDRDRRGSSRDRDRRDSSRDRDRGRRDHSRDRNRRTSRR